MAGIAAHATNININISISISISISIVNSNSSTVLVFSQICVCVFEDATVLLDPTSAFWPQACKRAIYKQASRGVPALTSSLFLWRRTTAGISIHQHQSHLHPNHTSRPCPKADGYGARVLPHACCCPMI
jgi:hypothetical protein